MINLLYLNIRDHFDLKVYLIKKILGYFDPFSEFKI